MSSPPRTERGAAAGAPEPTTPLDAACEGPVPGLEALQRERLPAQDLWAGIESVITAPQRAAARRREPSLWPYGLAASIGVALVTGMLLRMPAAPELLQAAGIEVAVEIAPETTAGWASTVVAQGSKPYDHREGESLDSTAPRSLRLLRSESLDNAPALVAQRAASPESGLMKATYSAGGHQAAHAQQAILRANLKLASQAEREVRRALKDDPESQSLQRLLLSAQQQRELITTLLIHDPG